MNRYVSDEGIDMDRISFGIERAEEKEYLVIYDISNNKRRARLAKILGGYGTRIQYSAFESKLNSVKYKGMINQVTKLVDSNDSIRVYKLGQERDNTVYDIQSIKSIDNSDCDLIIV